MQGKGQAWRKTAAEHEQFRRIREGSASKEKNFKMVSAQWVKDPVVAMLISDGENSFRCKPACILKYVITHVCMFI